MAEIQRTYDLDPPIGRNGQIANGVPCTTRTYVNGGTDDIAFGVGVQRDGNSATDAVVGGAGAGSSPWASTDFLGVTVEDRTREDETKAYASGSNMTVITEGDIWVTVGEAVVAGGVVTVNDSTGVLGTGGSATKAVIPGARWATSAAKDGLALLSLQSGTVG